MFPKGGWELDEDIELAAARETLEEGGVVGLIGEKLGEWIFKSKSQEKYHEGSMFPMLVTEVLDVWPEKNVRHRVWVCPTSLYFQKHAKIHSIISSFMEHLIRFGKKLCFNLKKAEIYPMKGGPESRLFKSC